MTSPADRWRLRVLALAVLAVCLLHAACGRKREPSAVASRERLVTIGGPVTETVFALGAGQSVVGVDTSSVFPSSASKLPQVGYQRALLAEGILSLSPSLVLAVAEAGPEVALQQLASAKVRVERVPPALSAPAARARIERIAGLLGRDPKPLLETFDAELERARAYVAVHRARPKVLSLYARGGNTLLVFGAKTAAAAMVELAGGENAVTAFEGAKPMTSEAVVAAAPDVILLPTRGMESVGGIDGVLALPGVAQTPAGAARHVITLDDLELLGFGPRTGKAALALARELHESKGNKP